MGDSRKKIGYRNRTAEPQIGVRFSAASCSRAHLKVCHCATLAMVSNSLEPDAFMLKRISPGGRFMPILVGFLWALGGALVTLVGLVIWAASQEPSGAASRFSRQAPDESLVTAARIKELEKDLEHQNDLGQYVDTDIATRMLIVAGSAAQRAKFGHADYAALRPLLAEGIVNHLPATTSERFKQALAQPLPLQAIAAAAVKYGLSDAATNIILDVFGRDQATWSPAEQQLFSEWQSCLRCLEDADKESV